MISDSRLLRGMTRLLVRRMIQRRQDPQAWLEEAAMALSVLAESGKHTGENPYGGADRTGRGRMPCAALDALICLEYPRLWLASRLDIDRPPRLLREAER